MSEQVPGAPSSRPRSQAEWGSDYALELLRDLGIEYVAFNPGASFRGLHDSLVNFGDTSSPKIILTCHEEVSVSIAHGYARATGRPMAAVLHNVVGLQHASMAIFNAWVDRVPVFVLGGTGPMDTTKRLPWIDWIHTALVQGNLVRDYTKFDDQPASLAALPESLLRAYRTMMVEPRGPVYVCLDAGLQESRVGDEELERPDPELYVRSTRLHADPAALAQAADWLTEAQRPLIYVSWLGRHPETVTHLVALAEELGCPVVSSDDRLNFPTTHPLNLTGSDKGLFAEADLILALDVWDLRWPTSTFDRATRVPRSVLRPEARVIQISLGDLSVRGWAHDFQSLHPTNLSIVADTSLAIPALVEEVRARLAKDKQRIALYDTRSAEVGVRHKALRDQWRAEAERSATDTPISLAYLAAEVWRLIKDEDWVLAFHGQNLWPHRLWDFTRADQYTSGLAGAGIGHGIGAAIGVALAHQQDGRLCVALEPDGDLLYNSAALWTLANLRLPLLLIMHNNRSYFNSEEHAARIAEFRQRPEERKGIGTQLVDPAVDFASIARGFGLWATGPVEDPRALRSALEQALHVVSVERRPALVDVVTQPR